MNNVPRTMNTFPRTNHLSCLSHRVPPRHLYICRESSTNHLLFMQNKPNFQKSQMNVCILLQRDYENKSNWTIGQNKPNSNPISSKAKMSLKSLIKKSGHTLLWIYLNLFLTPPGQTVRILASDFESALLPFRKEFTWRL